MNSGRDERVSVKFVKHKFLFESKVKHGIGECNQPFWPPKGTAVSSTAPTLVKPRILGDKQWEQPDPIVI